MVSRYRFSVFFANALCLFIGAACSGSKSGSQTKDASPTSAFPLEFSTAEERVGQTLLLKFTWKNTSPRLIYFDNPYQHIIFSASDINTYLPIRDCPCNAPCAPRPNSVELAPGEVFELIWDRYLTTCKPSLEGNDLISDRSKAVSGSYFIRIHIREEGQQDYKAIEYTFNIP